MAPPPCFGCKVTKKDPKTWTKSSELSEDMQLRWAAEEGYKWYWSSDNCAWWTLCVSCHRTAWPLDKRYNNSNSRPVDLDVRGAREFCLTLTPPEYLRDVFSRWWPLPGSASSAVSMSSAPLVTPSSGSLVFFLRSACARRR